MTHLWGVHFYFSFSSFFCHSLIYKKLSENLGTYTCPSLWCFSSSFLVTVVFKLKVTATGFLIRNEHFATHPELTGKRQSLPVQKYSLGKQLMWMVKKGGKMVEIPWANDRKLLFIFLRLASLWDTSRRLYIFYPPTPRTVREASTSSPHANNFFQGQ